MKNSLVYVLATACTLTSVATVVSALSQGRTVDIVKTNGTPTVQEIVKEDGFYKTIMQAEDIEFENGFVMVDPEKVEITKSPEIKLKKAELGLKALKRISPEARDYISNKEGLPTLKELNELGSIYSIPEGLLYSVMLKESNGDTFAESNKRARGLFQFIPQTAKDFGLIISGKDFRTDEWRSADAAARYLAWIFTYFHNGEDRLDVENYKYVLAGYNAGIGKVKRGGLNSLRIPNYTETKDYVRIVIGYTKGDYYKVKKGDTLYKIAKLHNLTRKEVTRMNDGVNQKTLIADKYLLVNKSKASDSYQVKKGDTLYGIAQRHSTSVPELLLVNSLKNNMIRVGQELSLPF